MFIVVDLATGYLEAVGKIRAMIRASVRAKLLNGSPLTGKHIADMIAPLVSNLANVTSSAVALRATIKRMAHEALNSTIGEMKVSGWHSSSFMWSFCA